MKVIVLGSSIGGLNALSTILPVLPKNFPLPIIIVQHLSPSSGNFMSRHLDSISRVKVKEVEEKEEILPGVVYIAPSNYHVLVEEDNTISLSVEERVNYARPSIDVLFETAADVYGSNLIGIILTGANNDGSQGLKKIKKLGGIAIVQEPETAENADMPKAALDATEVDYILPLEEIGPFLVKHYFKNIN